MLKFILTPRGTAKPLGKPCPVCGKEHTASDSELCSCGHHFRMGARKRINYIADPGSFEELYAGIESADPLAFPSYGKKIEKARASSGEKESVITGLCAIGGEKTAIFVMDPLFMMGSMGGATGEKITRLFEKAAELELPVIGYSVSGGARMQEGMISLMQMAKTSGAVARHSEKGLLFISVLTDPTTGGVTASFAMEGDIILCEPGATVGFAGRRVVEQTTHQPLPEGFQTAEFVLDHGFIDAIVPRDKQRETLSRLLRLHRREK